MTVRRYSTFAAELGQIPLEGTGDATATPAAVALVAVTPAPTVSGSSSTTPAAVALTATVPSAAALHVWSGSNPTTLTQTSAFEIGTLAWCTTSVSVVGVRIWNPGLGARTSRSAKLWEMSGTSWSGGTKVAEVSLPDTLTAAWTDYLFPTPYTVVPTKYFIVSYDVGGFGLNDISHVTYSTQVDSADGKVHYPATNPGCYTTNPDTVPDVNFTNEFWGIDVLYSDGGTVTGGATPTPAAVSLVDVVPAPTVSGTSNITPAAVVLAVVTPAPTATGGGGGDGFATPAAVALVDVVPAPTTTGGGGSTPAAVVLTVVTPAPTATGTSGGTATPAAVTLTVTVPAPTAGGSSNTAPSAVARTVVVPAPDAHVPAAPAAVMLSVVTPAPDAHAPPPNDNWANAIAITDGVTLTGVSNLGARAEPGEQFAPAFAVPDLRRTMWWKYTATVSGLVSIDTAGNTLPSGDTTLAVWTGASLAGLTLVAYNDDNPAAVDNSSYVQFYATTGVTYYIQIDGYGGTSYVGQYVLTVGHPGTANPGTVARTVSVPAPTATGASGAPGTATPAAVTRTVTIPAPTVVVTAQTNEIDTITVAPGATGTITVIVDGVATAPISVTGSAATVQAAIEALAGIAPGDVIASGGPLGTSSVTLVWAGAYLTTPVTVTVTDPTGTGLSTLVIAPVPYVPIGRVRLYDRLGTTLVANLDNAFDVEWQEVDNGTGVGKFTIALSDTDSALVRVGQVVYCDLYDRANVFSWRVEAYPQTRIQGAEEYGQVMNVSGRGSAGILETALCYPYGGVDAVPVRSVRSFSFASQDYVEVGPWGNAVEIAEQGDHTTYWMMYLPAATEQSPAPGAWPLLPIIPSWIWAQADNTPIGTCYFRETFVTAAQANVSILATGDNFWTLYFDGVAVLGDSENPEAWQEHRSVDMVLPAGSHTIAAVVENLFRADLTPVQNPAALLAAIIIPSAADGEAPPDMMLISDSGWHSLAYPAEEPGWTAGDIIIKLVAEAQARGLLTNVVLGFTGVTDTSGAAWETIPEFGVNLGASLLDTLGQLVADGWVDWAMTPSGWILQMWKRGNRGIDTTVVLEAGINLGEATYEPAHPILNRLLVTYNNGMFTVGDAVAEAVASQAVYGIIEGFLTLDAAKPAEAMRLALKSLDEAMDAELAITYQVEPSAFELLRGGGIPSSKPYVSFGVGDSLTGPDETGVAHVYTVLGITITLDDMGDPNINLEANRRRVAIDEVRVKLLQTLGSSIVGTAPGSRASVFENSGPYYPTRAGTTGDIIAAHTPTPGEVTFTVPGLVDTLGTSPRWVTPYQVNIYEVVMAVAVAGTGGITVSVLGDTFTLPAGQTEITIATETHRLGSNSFTISLTDIGAGDAEGLTVTLRYRYYTGAI